MSDDQSIPVTNENPPPGEPVAARLRYRAAYKKVQSEQPPLDAAELLVVNVDVTTAYTTVIGALDRIMAMRERAAQLAHFDLKNIDNLEMYALALMHAQGEYVSASAPPEAIVALNEEGIALRDNLYSDAVALANRGLVNAEPLKDFKSAPGYKNLAEDLVGLSSLLRRSWDKIGARTVITMAELDQAEDLSERLLHAVAMRENQSNVLAEAIQKRLEVFTLLVNAYDQARRAINFLRWQERDLEDIAPSLYAGRSRKKDEPGPPVPPPATPANPVAPPPTSAGPTLAGNTMIPATAPESSAGVPQDNPFAPKAVTPRAAS